MGVLLFAAVALIGFRLWMRLRETDLAIERLTERVIALEYERTSEAVPVREGRRVEEAAAGPVPSAPVEPPTKPIVQRPVAPPPFVPPQPAAAPPSPQPTLPPSVIEASPAARVRVDTSSADRDALESRIGSRWLLYVGVVAIVIGVSYFEKLAIDNHWVSETWRVMQGGFAGLVLVLAGLRIAKRGYRLYGQILSGTGVAIMYVSTYAAFNFYQLISQPAAFVVMFAITALGAWLADSQRSQGLALVAVSGGFATPFLLPSATGAEAALFGYDCVLIAGTILLARRRDWPILNIVSYTFTAVTFLSWAAVFYAATKYATTELFLTMFGAMFLYALHSSYQSTNPAAKLQRAVLWTAPFGYYLLSVANLFEHSQALLIYLVMLGLVGIIAGSRTNSWVRLLFWFAVAAPLLVWSDTHGGRAWLVGGLAAWAGVYVLNLAGLFEASLGESPFRDADIALLHLNALAAYLGAYVLIEPVRVVACAPLAAALAILNLGFAFFVKVRQREQALHFVALAATFITIAIALQFDAAWITNGWAAEAVLVTWLGLRERRPWLRFAGLTLFAAAVGRLIGAQLSPPSVGETLLFNVQALSGLFVSGLAYVLAYLHHRYGSDPARRTPVAIALVSGPLLLLSVVAREIVAYWQRHVAPPFEPEAHIIAATLVAGAAIAWLGLRRKQEWVRFIGGAIIAAAAFALFSLQLNAAPAGYVALANGRVATGVVAVLILYGLVVLHRRLGQHIPPLPVNIALLTMAASLLTLSLLTSEIDAFWAIRGAARVWSGTREGLQSVAWAGIGGFLIWYGLSARRWWSRGVGVMLLVVAIYRLVWLHFANPPAGYTILLNGRVLTSVVVIAVLYGLAHVYSLAVDPEEGRSSPATALRLVANALTITLLTSEITAYWHVFDARQVSRSASSDMHFAREMMLSITWAVYATILVIVGLFRKYAPIRYFAMTVFAVTIVKVFAIDLAELDRIYRVLSIIGLGVTLLLTSYLYQRLSAEARQG
jgi:uncharacterized membrane protein